VALIDSAEKSIEVMCFVLSSQKVAEALLRAHRRGVRVRVLLDNLYSHDSITARWSYIPFKELKKAGIDCKYDNEDSKFHHKVVIVDGRSVVTGSLNLSTSAEKGNDENVLIIDSAEVARDYRDEFERWWKYYPGDPGKPPAAERGDDDV
jgi:phosphatidylserine/phosphatidylglycerophosphate/cardiolipin synthase-like enzyme